MTVVTVVKVMTVVTVVAELTVVPVVRRKKFCNFFLLFFCPNFFLQNFTQIVKKLKKLKWWQN